MPAEGGPVDGGGWVEKFKEEWVTGDVILKSFVHDPPKKTSDGAEQWGLIWNIVSALTLKQLKEILLYPIENMDSRLLEGLLSDLTGDIFVDCPNPILEHFLQKQHVIVGACYYNLATIPCWREALNSEPGTLLFFFQGVCLEGSLFPRLCPALVALSACRHRGVLLEQLMSLAKWAEPGRVVISLFASCCGIVAVENMLSNALRSNRALQDQAALVSGREFCSPFWSLPESPSSPQSISVKVPELANRWFKFLTQFRRSAAPPSPPTNKENLGTPPPKPFLTRPMAGAGSLPMHGKNGEKRKLTVAPEPDGIVKKAAKVCLSRAETVDLTSSHIVTNGKITRAEPEKMDPEKKSFKVASSNSPPGKVPTPKAATRVEVRTGGSRKEGSSPVPSASPTSAVAGNTSGGDRNAGTPGEARTEGHEDVIEFVERRIIQRKAQAINAVDISKAATMIVSTLDGAEDTSTVESIVKVVTAFLSSVHGFTATVIEDGDTKVIARGLHCFFSTILALSRCYRKVLATGKAVAEQSCTRQSNPIPWYVNMLGWNPIEKHLERKGAAADKYRLPHSIGLVVNNWASVFSKLMAGSPELQSCFYLAISRLRSRANILTCFEAAALLSLSQKCARAYYHTLVALLHKDNPREELPPGIFNFLSKSEAPVVKDFVVHVLAIFDRCVSAVRSPKLNSNLKASMTAHVNEMSMVMGALACYPCARHILLDLKVVKLMTKVFLLQEGIDLGIAVNASIVVSYLFGFDEGDEQSRAMLIGDIVKVPIVFGVTKCIAPATRPPHKALLCNGLEIFREMIELVYKGSGPANNLEFVFAQKVAKAKIYLSFPKLLTSAVLRSSVAEDEEIYVYCFEVVAGLSRMLFRYHRSEGAPPAGDLFGKDSGMAKAFGAMLKTSVDASRRSECLVSMKANLKVRGGDSPFCLFMKRALKV